jgi:integral membrane protein (TIGR01906 family)
MKINYVFISYILIIVFLPLLIITSNIRVLSNDIRIYEYCIDNYNITGVTGLSRPDLIKAYQHWIDYYNTRETTPQVLVNKNGTEMKLLSQKEVFHMEDVKKLINLDYYVQVLSIIVLFVAASIIWFRSKDKWQILRGLFWGTVITDAAMAILAIISFFFFDQLFILFHQIGFSNQFWILDPMKDYLIMMFPGDFFTNVALFGFTLVLVQSLAIGLIAFIILKIKRAGLIRRKLVIAKQ